MSRDWSFQQKTIFAWFSGNWSEIESIVGRSLSDGEKKSLVVRARAGTGKSTTIVAGIEYAPEQRILVAAFNKKIAEEMTAKLSNPAAESKTLHSVGYAAIRKFVKCRIDETTGRRADSMSLAAAPSAPPAILKLISNLHTKAREIAPLATQPDEVIDIAFAFDLVPDEEWNAGGFGIDFVCRAAVDAMRIGAESAPCGIDFADMIFLPIRNKWLLPTYDLVVVDEAQDMTIAQLLIARGVCRPGGRIAVVGDDRQAIYGFRGADSGSLDRLKAELGALELGLTTTYRCGRAIVEVAKEIVPDYEAGPTNPEGEVLSIGIAKLSEMAEPGDFVLSRKNAPLTRVALGFLRAGKRAKIAGRDVGAQLRALVKKLAVGKAASSMPELLGKIGAWEEREIARAEKSKSPDARIQIVVDLADTLRALAEDMRGVPELLARIEDLFVDEPGRAFIACSSVHRSKGLEADRVYVLVDTLMPQVACTCGHRHRGGSGCDRCGCASYKPDPKQQQEELNISYVAYTRAKSTLVRVLGLP